MIFIHGMNNNSKAERSQPKSVRVTSSRIINSERCKVKPTGFKSTLKS